MFVTVTGGSGSGKSAFAEDWITGAAKGERIYLATMLCADEESRRRIRRHRERRQGKQFRTLECPTALALVPVPRGSAVLLEDMANLAANELFDARGAGEAAYGEICRGLLCLRENASQVCVVTDEVCSDGGFYDPSTRAYLELLGRINTFLAEISDACYEVVCGIPLCLKSHS